MPKAVLHAIAFLIGASSIYVFATSPLNPPYWVFYAGLVCTGLLSSLFLTRRAGLTAGLGIITSLTVIGILNGMERDVGIETFLTLPFVLATMFLFIAIGSYLGDMTRMLMTRLRGPGSKA